ncbi:MAG: molecular chaperone TorD family protein [Bacillus sp. (in: Bacteria)]|nr:molecular chaperone TorD family protein [Bacillus sp. (in: firmicutes)]
MSEMIKEKPLEAVETALELRLEAYNILRNLFLSEPSVELLQELREKNSIANFPFLMESAPIKDGVEQIESYFNTDFLDEKGTFDSLHWDYTRMFIGPATLPAPLWGSAYLNKERLLFQEETLKVRGMYLKYHLLPDNYLVEADDHLGMELDFMYQLTRLMKDALKNKDTERVNDIIQSQLAFLQDHLLSWVPAFHKDMKTSAATEFYRGVADLLLGFLVIDKVLLNEIKDTLVVH